MPNVIHDLCGKIIASEKLVEHRMKCYVKDVAYGFNDPKSGQPMIVLNGQILPAPQAPAPVVVSEPEEESS